MGIMLKAEKVFFYVDSSPNNIYPVIYNANFFEIIDSRISCHWSFNKFEGGIFITFKEWINVPNAILKFMEGEDGYTHEDGYYLPTYLHFRELLLKEK